MSTETVRRPTLVAGAAMLAVALFAVNDASATYGLLAFLTAVGGGVLAVATGLATREEPLSVFAASVLAPVGGVVVLATAGLSAADLPLLADVLDPLVVVALATAGFGATAAFTGGVGGGAVGRAFSVVVATTILPFLATVAVLVGRVQQDVGVLGELVDIVGLIVGLVRSPTGSGIDVVVFFVLVAATARALAAGVSAAPLVELAPRDRRESVSRASRYVVAACLTVWRLFALSWAVVFFAFVTGIAERAVAQMPDSVVSLVGTLASAGVLRTLMLAAIVVSLLVVVVLRVARLATGDHRESLRRVASAAGGGVLAVVVGVVFASRVVAEVRRALPQQARANFEGVVGTFGEPALALVALLAPLAALSALLLAFAGLGWLRAIPQRSAPAAVAAGGLVVAAAAAGMQGAPREFVFALVAAGMVAWDVGEYGVGVAAELERHAPTARAEVVHVAAAAAVGVLAYYAATLVGGVAAGFRTPDAGAALVALVAAGVGLAALVGALAE
ncbi:DUF7519 family protein [Halobacterium noricense]|uniref:DUF7519 family protein n=1 Tax=Halobacterium noricense TaxID=223182 RepID=UPI001E483453|nr:hypothetical protein [Halobacterium noricense]UHH24391.1 hypothetical protein LT974_10365 [Halobacterium noricense]